MNIRNVSKNTILSTNAARLDNFIDKSHGLIAAFKPKTIAFTTRFGIHTFGVRFPIDVLILDGENQVAALKAGLKPKRFFFWNPKYKTVLELPAGIIKKSKTARFDQIAFD